MVINYIKLKEIENWYGSPDFRITFNSYKDLELRFRYWKQVNIEELQEILGERFMVEEWEIEDDECGILYNYIIK